jgi:hypothetical protein
MQDLLAEMHEHFELVEEIMAKALATSEPRVRSLLDDLMH